MVGFPKDLFCWYSDASLLCHLPCHQPCPSSLPTETGLSLPLSFLLVCSFLLTIPVVYQQHFQGPHKTLHLVQNLQFPFVPTWHSIPTRLKEGNKRQQRRDISSRVRFDQQSSTSECFLSLTIWIFLGGNERLWNNETCLCIPLPEKACVSGVGMKAHNALQGWSCRVRFCGKEEEPRSSEPRRVECRDHSPLNAIEKCFRSDDVPSKRP